ncbi:MAG: radical SAM protein [Candidatus Heimdallarchaeota archaeon]
MNIDVTNKCNLRCSYCYNSWNLNRGLDIDTEKCIDLITELFEVHSIFHLTIAGGEPLLHKGIFEVIEKCFIKYDPRIVLLSNGTALLNNSIYAKFSTVCSKLNDAGTPLKMQISLDSQIPEIHDLQRDRGTDVLVAIQKVLALPVELQLACVITKQNITVADQIIEFYYPKVKNFHFMNIMPSPGRSGGEHYWNMIPDPQDIEDFHAHILEIEKKYSPIKISKIKSDCELDMHGGTIKGRGCLAGTTRIEIDPYLDVRACCMATETLGNLNNQSFDELWYSDKAENIRSNPEPYCLVWR